MKTYQRRWINEQAPAGDAVGPNELAAFKKFLIKDNPAGKLAKNPAAAAAALEGLHELGNLIKNNKTLLSMLRKGLEEEDLTRVFTSAATAEVQAQAKEKTAAAGASATAPVAPAPRTEAFSIKEEANKRNSSFIKYLFEGAAVKKEEEPEEKEETEKEEPKEERPKKVEAPKEKKKEKEGSAVSNLLDSLEEVPATEWKRITDADEAFEVIMRGVMKKFTGITYAERHKLKVKFISAFRSVKPDA